MNSKKLSFALRHDPGAFGLTLATDGSGDLQEVAVALGTTVEELRRITADDNKGRFVIRRGRIWAAQGHSIPVDVPLELVTVSGDLFHGTKADAVRLITQFGLKPQSRLYVHLSPDVGTAKAVAGRRKGESRMLRVDGAALAAAGELWRSSNGVYLAKHVPPRLIRVMHDGEL